jgi:hypothetical protein
MKQLTSVSTIICLFAIAINSQTVIRKQFQAPSTVKLASIPDFVLPAIYSDRTAHPLPSVVNHETDAVSSKYFPPRSWCIDGWSCANGSAVSYTYDYAVQTFYGIASSGTTPIYTYNYTYHFLDNANQSQGGDGWMYLEAFDILKATGCPTSTDFGGFDGAVDKSNAWMSGYDKYYAAMKVRADQYYKINPGTTASDELIKQVVYDFADGSPAGALISFQANSEAMPSTTVNGRKTFTNLGGGGGHCLTICGYDDSHQGGSWLIQSGWGDGDYWCPYALLHSGSSWYNDNAALTVNNKYVMFCRIKKNYTPKFTFKVNLTHNQRNQICIMTGVANSSTATAPTSTMDYAGAFNYAGGALPMCGTGLSSTIEIGLDLTDFASVVSNGQGTFFLKIISTGGTGQVNSLSLMDYNGATAREIPCTKTNVAISGTIIMGVPWTGSVTETEFTNVRAAHQGNGLTAVYQPASRTARFLYPCSDLRSALLQIRNVDGRTVMTKACSPGISGGSMASASWDLRDYFGLPVSSGVYIASVNLTGLDGKTRQLATKLTVRD